MPRTYCGTGGCVMADPLLTLVAALGRNNVIGKDNQLLWHLPADMAYFKKLTEHHVVIMGSKTYASLPERFRPLPKRLNIVLTRQKQDPAHHTMWSPDLGIEQVIWSPNLDAAWWDASTYAADHNQNQVFVIGGGEIYAKCLPNADRLILTHVHADYDGDTIFPTFDKSEWTQTVLSSHPATDTQPAFDIVQYERI